MKGDDNLLSTKTPAGGVLGQRDGQRVRRVVFHFLGIFLDMFRQSKTSRHAQTRADKVKAGTDSQAVGDEAHGRRSIKIRTKSCSVRSFEDEQHQADEASKLGEMDNTGLVLTSSNSASTGPSLGKEDIAIKFVQMRMQRGRSHPCWCGLDLKVRGCEGISCEGSTFSNCVEEILWFLLARHRHSPWGRNSIILLDFLKYSVVRSGRHCPRSGLRNDLKSERCSSRCQPGYQSQSLLP